jgi:hypothetical protein
MWRIGGESDGSQEREKRDSHSETGHLCTQLMSVVNQVVLPRSCRHAPWIACKNVQIGRCRSLPTTSI